MAWSSCSLDNQHRSENPFLDASTWSATALAPRFTSSLRTTTGAAP